MRMAKKWIVHKKGRHKYVATRKKSFLKKMWQVRKKRKWRDYATPSQWSQRRKTRKEMRKGFRHQRNVHKAQRYRAIRDSKRRGPYQWKRW